MTEAPAIPRSGCVDSRIFAGTPSALALGMSDRRKQEPASYEEIVRRTVPDPVLAFKPSLEEEQRSRHRFGAATEHRIHPLTEAERITLARVEEALGADPELDLDGVEVDIDGRELVLRGTVPGRATWVRIAEVAGVVEGVDRIDNQLVIGDTRDVTK